MRQLLYWLILVFAGLIALPARADEPCPSHGPLFVIREANSQTDSPEHQLVLIRYLKQGLETPNALVILGPQVDLDFRHLPLNDFAYVHSGRPQRTIEIARCVRLTSVAALSTLPSASDVAVPAHPGPASHVQLLRTRSLGHGDIAADTRGPAVLTTGDNPTPREWASNWADKIVEARSPIRPGPVIRYGPSRSTEPTSFLAVHCQRPDQPNDHVRLSDFRLYGVRFDQQNTNEHGINIYRCLDIDISNMEIAGWGAFGLHVEDTDKGAGPDDPSVFQITDSWPTTGRISSPEQIRIHGNFFHHNQHPQSDTDAEGYGVSLGDGAWARIYENVFDFNRHSIATTGNVGGYRAERNLVLKGGGYHDGLLSTYTHQFDVHGTGCPNHLCGDAGYQFWFTDNTFQYTNGPSIKIRGHVRRRADINGNVFAKDDRDSWDTDPTGAAIVVRTYDGIHIGNDNRTSVDDWGKYQVCDFDADGVDDLFLATGATWWFSGYGEFQWTFLNAQTFRGDQLQVGQFDPVPGCDVLAQHGNDWLLFSGGRGEPVNLGAFGVRVKDVVFGRFGRPRPGIDFRDSEVLALMRARNGDWMTSQLSRANRWTVLRAAGSSSPALKDLRFADFTGDGLTDVLAVVNGHWQISEGGTSEFAHWNDRLSDPMGALYFADLDTGRQRDVLKVDRRWMSKVAGRASPTWTLTQQWYVSRSGRGEWIAMGTPYVWTYPASATRPRTPPTFAGNFGAAPGGGVLLVDSKRIGYFRAPGEAAVGSPQDWTARFAY